jgi:hypothetical protein
MSRAIAENVIMTAITSSPPLGADPLGCHIRIYNKKISRNETKPMHTPLHDLISPITDQCHMCGLTADSVHSETPPPLDLSLDVVKSCADAICTGPRSITKKAK